MAKAPLLLDQYGRPIEREKLTASIAGPTITGVRSPLAGYPGDGLNPLRLARILREADEGEPLRYFELAEQIEERDLHYAGVLATRKRSVAQLDISVEAASDKPPYAEHAKAVELWLKRDELQDELFDILDAIGKGISLTEILWDTSSGQWMPKKLEWRDPRWFRFSRIDGKTPLLRTDAGDVELPSFKFVNATIRAKSGLPVRSGLARLASWSWMFKAFTLRDWAIFTQTYGQPIRVGKYGPGATEEDKDTLFRAVANIAGDCAAIVPTGMEIEFVESGNVSSGTDLYKLRAEWLDQQVSKAVLGQTATTDAVTGGLGSGKEHRQVQEDIERADAKALAAILNRDLIRPWIDLEYGPQDFYPKLSIGRAEDEDLQLLAESLSKLVPVGLRVQASEVRERFGFGEPEEGAEVLAPAQASPLLGFGNPSLIPGSSPGTSPQGGGERALQAAGGAADVADALAWLKKAILLHVAHMRGKAPTTGEAGEKSQAKMMRQMLDAFEALGGEPGEIEGATEMAAMQAADPASRKSLRRAHDTADMLAAQAEDLAEPSADALIDKVRELVMEAKSLDELKERLLKFAPELPAADLANALAQALAMAELLGRSEIAANASA